jgi:phosphonate transport system substrate-binding protein
VAKLRLSYYPWIAQTLTPQALDASIRAFAAVFAKKLGADVEVQAPLRIPDQIAWLRDGRTDVALMNPLGYALAHRATPDIEAVTIALREPPEAPGAPPVPTYRAQIYTSIGSGITTLAQLHRRTFAFGSAQSTSNFLVPARHLQDARLPPICSCKAVSFLGGHQDVAKAVYAGTVDAGAGHDGVIHDLSQQPGYSDAAHRLVRLAWTETIKSDPIATKLPRAQVDEVRKALIAAGEDVAGNHELFVFWQEVKGLTAAAADDFDFLIDDMAELGLKYD